MRELSFMHMGFEKDPEEEVEEEVSGNPARHAAKPLRPPLEAPQVDLTFSPSQPQWARAHGEVRMRERRSAK
eukprot:9417953-Pyramimonas_sp.AAC.1